ncbi:MAG: asparagine synthase (glutamine-hydrolyzing) [Elusimicrobia bacterium]|nr:asparagine synthase (glutamine-hydrolyzing) [Elusimicrobiota bacterium]
MCGICGQLSLDGAPLDPARVAAASRYLEHRGPDDQGAWTEGPVSFGFRRLSILDLEGGHQPMLSEDGAAAIVFNGEIYNHPELKAELEAEGVRFRTRSDTETILHLYARRGAAAFERLNGMFAVGIWDRARRELVLARDPVGVKPLYYSVAGGVLSFASELRALLAAGIPDALDPAAVQEYLAFGFVHGPKTIVSAVRKLPPGHLLIASSAGVSLRRYWDLPAPPPPSRSMDMDEAESRIEAALKGAVKRQMLSDVPLGAFLSGGVDSSLIAAFMAESAGRALKTFTIGFSGAAKGLDESKNAKAVARHLGTDHQELVLPADVLDRIEDLAPSLDEPIADSAILPTHLLARFARKSVKVVLTGEGADELFAGYNRYKAAHLSEWVDALPAGGKLLAKPLARRLGKGPIFKGLPFPSLEEWARAGAHADRAWLAPILDAEFRRSVAGEDILPEAARRPGRFGLDAALAFDFRTVLADALLMKADKATMRASLEARVPFLDREMVDAACALPASLKMRRLKGKFLLRRIAAKRLPKAAAWRRKHGFVVPWEEWVVSPKNRVVDDLLAGSALSARGVFDMDVLRQMRRRLVGAETGGKTVDRGLMFRVAVLGLWLESIGR